MVWDVMVLLFQPVVFEGVSRTPKHLEKDGFRSFSKGWIVRCYMLSSLDHIFFSLRFKSHIFWWSSCQTCCFFNASLEFVVGKNVDVCF